VWSPNSKFFVCDVWSGWVITLLWGLNLIFFSISINPWLIFSNPTTNPSFLPSSVLCHLSSLTWMIVQIQTCIKVVPWTNLLLLPTKTYLEFWPELKNAPTHEFSWLDLVKEALNQTIEGMISILCCMWLGTFVLVEPSSGTCGHVLSINIHPLFHLKLSWISFCHV